MAPKSAAVLSRKFVLLMGFAIGVIVANLYYAQPLVSLISQSLGLDPKSSGFIVTLTQIGYGLGVLFFIPLGDLIENRKLILTMIAVAAFGVLGLALSESIIPYFMAALITGLGTSAVQMIVPYVSHLSPEETRGRTVGSLMSGLMLGIMLSRPLASFMTDLFSWHAIFFVSAALLIFLFILLFFKLPERVPGKLTLSYKKLLASMGHLLIATPVLRRRGIYQAFMFGTFSLFWTATPMLLAGPDFRLSQTSIALFALAGVAGAIVAPLAGRFADKGWTRAGTLISMLVGSGSFLLTHIFAPGSTMSLVFLVLAAILLDAGITANLVLGQRAIFSLPGELRSRLNGLYIAIIFVGGAIGSFLGAWAYAQGAWQLTSVVGFVMPLMALAYFATENLSFSKKLTS